LAVVTPAEAPLPAWREIRPKRGWAALDLQDIWSHRELLFFLSWREVRIRYAQTLLGVVWAILQPLMNTIVFTILFGKLAGVASDGLPYALWSYCGLLPWMYFAQSLQLSTGSLVTHQALITKVYFPRILVPASGVLVPLLDMGCAFAMFLGVMAYYSAVPTLNIVWLPVFLALAIALAFALGLWLSALNAQYRDVRHALPFVVQLWMFISPVVYSTKLIPESMTLAGFAVPLRAIYGLNPMVGVIEGFRWSLLGKGQSPDAILLVSVAFTIVLLVSGCFYFRQLERRFADFL
jgi:lipopolysaccharide transport system permease protein